MRVIALLFLVVVSTLLESCKTASPRLTNAHAGKYKIGTIPSGDFLDVQVAVVPIIPPKSEAEKLKTFFDLRDSIPQTFLRVLGDEVTTGADLIKFIKEPLSVKSEQSPGKLKTDFATQKVRFVMGNIKNYQVLASEDYPEFVHPNTRLAWLNTQLDFSGTDFQIVSIDKLESEFEEIDLGAVARTQEASFTSKLTGQYGITNVSGNKNTSGSESVGTGASGSVKNVYDKDGNVLGSISTGTTSSDTISSGSENSNSSTRGLGANGEVGFSNKEIIAEALQVRLKRLKTGFVFNKESITISQHGSNLLDISDNVVVTASIYPKTGVRPDQVMNFSGLFKDYVPQDASKIKMNRRGIKYMDCTSRDVDVMVSSKGMMRAVQNKMRGDNILEFDDKVIYYPFDLSAKSSKTSITNWTNCTTVYRVKYEDPAGKIYYLKAGVGIGKEVHFVNEEKDLFDGWLRFQLANPVATKLTHPSLQVYLEEQTTIGAPRQRIDIIGPAINATKAAKVKDLHFEFELL